MTSGPRALNIPNSVLIAGVAMGAVHLLRLMLPDDDGLWLLVTLAFIPARYTVAAAGIPGGDWSAVTSFITYMFVHGDWTHLIVNLLWMLAFGSAVAKRVGDTGFFAFSALCGIAGALAHLILHAGDPTPVVGASAAISGQMAAALRIMFASRRGYTTATDAAATVPLPSVTRTLLNPQFLAILAVWVAINLLFGLGTIQLDMAQGSIAWEAHIGGFLCGMILIGLVDRRLGNGPSRGA